MLSVLVQWEVAVDVVPHQHHVVPHHQLHAEADVEVVFPHHLHAEADVEVVFPHHLHHAVEDVEVDLVVLHQLEVDMLLLHLSEVSLNNNKVVADMLKPLNNNNLLLNNNLSPHNKLPHNNLLLNKAILLAQVVVVDMLLAKNKLFKPAYSYISLQSLSLF